MIGDQQLGYALRRYYAEGPREEPDLRRMTESVMRQVRRAPQDRVPVRLGRVSVGASRGNRPGAMPDRAAPARFGASPAMSLTLVALFGAALLGGYLFAGTLSQDLLRSPSPAPATTSAPESTTPTTRPSTSPEIRTTTDLVPGVTLMTDEVEPGVLRILSDGIRDLPQPAGGWISSQRGPAASWSNVVAGADGSVWVFWPDESYRLGDPATHPPVPENAKAKRENRVVDRDGNLWAIVEGALRSFDGRAWTIRRENVGSFEVQLDGTVWSSSGGDPPLDVGEDPVDGLARLEGERWTLLRYDPVGDDGWFQVSPVSHPGPVNLLTVRGGVLWIWDIEPGPDGNVGGTEARQASDIGGVLAVDFGARGDYWVYQAVTIPIPGSVLPDHGGETRVMPFLAHIEDGPMVVYGEEQGVPRLGGIPAEGGPVRLLKTAPDGSVWLTPGTGEVDCQGIARFDGVGWTHYLSGRCIFALDIGPDGTVWAHAGLAGSMPGARDTFAIRVSAATTG